MRPIISNQERRSEYLRSTIIAVQMGFFFLLKGLDTTLCCDRIKLVPRSLSVVTCQSKLTSSGSDGGKSDALVARLGKGLALEENERGNLYGESAMTGFLGHFCQISLLSPPMVNRGRVSKTHWGDFLLLPTAGAKDTKLNSADTPW